MININNFDLILRWIFGRIGCLLSGHLMFFISCTSIFLMLAVSIERSFIEDLRWFLHFFNFKFFYLRYYAIYKLLTVFENRLRINLTIIALCTFKGLFWASLPLFGWSYYSLEGALTSCSVEWTERSANVISFNITIFVVVYFVPVLGISFTSIKLVILVVSSRNMFLMIKFFVLFIIFS